MAVVVPMTLKLSAPDALERARFDKMKPVRDAAVSALEAIRRLTPGACAHKCDSSMQTYPGWTGHLEPGSVRTLGSSQLHCGWYMR